MTESGTFEKLSAFLESPINSEYFPEQYSTAVTVGMYKKSITFTSVMKSILIQVYVMKSLTFRCVMRSIIIQVYVVKSLMFRCVL